MIQITKLENSILFEFSENQHYLYNGSIEVPYNTLSIIQDGSDMITLRKAQSNDIFLTARYNDFGASSVDDAVDLLADSLFKSEGGGGTSGLTPDEVQEMIDDSLDDYYNKDEVDAGLSGKADTVVVNQAISGVTDDILAVSGQVATKVDESDFSAHTANTNIHVSSQEKNDWNNKLDADDLAPYWTSGEVETMIEQAVSGVSADVETLSGAIIDINNRKVDTSAVTLSVTSASTNTQIPTAKAVYDAIQAGGGSGTTYQYYTENTETKSSNIHIEDTDEQTSGNLGVDGSSAMMTASGTETDGEGTMVQNAGVNASSLGASMYYEKFVDDEPLRHSYFNVEENIIGLSVESDVDPMPYSHLNVTQNDISLEVRSDDDHITTFAVSNSAVTINGENVVTEDQLAGYQPILSAGTGIDITNNVISATGGGVTVDPSLDSGSTNPVQNAVITQALTAHTTDTNVHFSGTQKSNYDNLESQFYVDDSWDITPMVVFNDFANDYSMAMGQFDQRISANTSAIAAKQDALSAGTGIDITNNVISATRGSDIPLAEVSGNKYVSGGNYNLQDELEGGIRGFAISTTDTEQGAARQWYLTELQYDGQLYKVDRVVDSGGTVLRSDESRYITQGDFDENIQMSVAYKVNLNQLDEGDGTIIDYALLQDSPSIIGVVMNEDEDEIKKWYPCSANIDEQALYVYTESNIIKYTLEVDEETGDFVAVKDVLPYGSSYYYTTAQTDTLLASKQDTLVSGTNIKTINNQSLLGSGNIDIQGGGATYSAGTNISIDTANTISCTLPLYNANNGSIKQYSESVVKFPSNYCAVLGHNNKIPEGYHYDIFISGSYNEAYSNQEAAFGKYNNSVTGSTASGNTLFSVGNGTADNARHNAFEIRQNGDIYVNDGTNDVKLQDTITGTAANTTALGGLSLRKVTTQEWGTISGSTDANTLYIISD